MGFQSYPRKLDEVGYAAPQNQNPENRRMLGMKRATDIILSSFALIFLLPVLVPIVIALRLTDGGPALYSQKRIGRDGEEFSCFKFRTMVTNAQERLDELLRNDPEARLEWEHSRKLKNDPRITSFGNFLRKSSLDELPQLINILKGEMSIVGPRPMLTCEVEMYGEHFTTYCSVRPGLTGPWQVSGRSDTSYEVRVKHTVNYVKNWNYLNDIVIIAKTVPAVLKSQGAA